MRSFNVKLWGCIGLIACFAIVIGCGSGSDLLDQTGTQWVAYSVPMDYDGEATSEIDVWQHACDTDFETLYPFKARVVVRAESYAADLSVESYDVYFRRNTGAYCEEQGAPPPDCGCQMAALTAEEMPDLAGTILDGKHYQYSSPIIRARDTVFLEGLLIWSQGDKGFYADTVIDTEPMTEDITELDSGVCVDTGIPERQTADLTYDFQIILHGRTVENTEVTIITPWSPVHFADFDTCG